MPPLPLVPSAAAISAAAVTAAVGFAGRQDPGPAAGSSGTGERAFVSAPADGLGPQRPAREGTPVMGRAEPLPERTGPRVRIEAVEVDGRAVAPSPDARGFEIPAGSRQLSVKLAGLIPVPGDAHDVRFKYRLRGLQEKWSPAFAEPRRVHFDRLVPGSYRFEVTAGQQGEWNRLPTSVAIIVRPHFWQTPPFRGLALLTVLAAAGLAFRHLATLKLRARLIQARYDQALVEERARIARDMHDDLGANLTRIAILSEVLKRDSLDPEVVRRQLDKISGTARDLVDGIGELVWAVNPKNDSVEDFITYLRAYAHRFADDTGLDCRVDFPADPGAAALSTEVRRNLFLVAKEALNNAAKHAGAVSVTLSFRRRGDRLQLVVEDDGRGFDPSGHTRFHNGLLNIQKRVADIGGEVMVDSRPGVGTQVEVEVRIAP